MEVLDVGSGKQESESKDFNLTNFSFQNSHFSFLIK